MFDHDLKESVACPTCDHTMQSVAPCRYWCPRCGTMKAEGGHDVPMLVERVRLLTKELINHDDGLIEYCRAIGLYEASRLPNERRTHE